MPLARRLDLCIFLAGSFFSIVGCVMRMVTVHRTNIYQTSMGMLWAGLEQCLIITLGSAPKLPALRQVKLGSIRNFGSSLASLVGLRSHWRRGHGSKSGGQGSASGRSSGDEKAPPNVVICERARPTEVDVEAARQTFPANARNLYDSYEVMADECESEHRYTLPQHPARSESGFRIVLGKSF